MLAKHNNPTIAHQPCQLTRSVPKDKTSRQAPLAIPFFRLPYWAHRKPNPTPINKPKGSLKCQSTKAA
nr:hypothetical protein [uncultured Kingella sp.]